MVEPKQRPGGGPGPGAGGLFFGRVIGVPVYVSPSWLLFLGFITVEFGPVIAHAAPGIGSARYLVAAGFAMLLGLSVLAHEIAHCAVARCFAIPIERISLNFLAGHSALAEEPATPGRSAAISAAGPVTNLALAAASLLVFDLLPSGGVGEVLTGGLAWANLVLGVSNLLPGLPLDGGQLLRALVWRIGGNARAGTIGAAWVGRLIAVCTLAAAVVLLSVRSTDTQLSALWALFIAAMLWVNSTSVLRRQATRDRLPGLAAYALSRSAITVAADLPLAEAVRRAQEVHARGIVVVDGESRPVGVVKEAAVIATPAARRPWLSVGSVSRQISTSELIDAGLTGDELLDRLRTVPAAEHVVITADGAIYGVLASEDVAQALTGRGNPGSMAGARYRSPYDGRQRRDP